MKRSMWCGYSLERAQNFLHPQVVKNKFQFLVFPKNNKLILIYREVTVQVPARAFHQFGTEQRDNVLNTVLVRGECSSNSESAEETGPTPSAQANNSRNNNDNYRGPSVQINQMITLNMVNNDN